MIRLTSRSSSSKDSRAETNKETVMKRIATGLYTDGRWAVTKDCDCSASCGSRWTLREIESIGSDGWPNYSPEIVSGANTKAELLALVREFWQ